MQAVSRVERGAQMNTNKKTIDTETMKIRLSTLWIFVMFNMVFADIVGFMNPGALENIMKGTVGLEITQELLLVFSIVLEIPIAMIFLSRVLKYGANRWANIIAGVITILFVIGGGSTYLSYIFFATVEVICISLIIWYAWKWPNPEILAQRPFGGNS
jgi:Sec-independent protein secretion pathway component TatC